MSDDVRKGRELLGMPVFSIQEGMRLGDITALLVRPRDSVVAAVEINTGALHRNVVLPLQALRTVGKDIVLIERVEMLGEPLSAAETRELDTGITGRPVITQSGERVGTVLGFCVNTSTGVIEAYRLKPESGLMSRLAATLLDRGLEIPVSQVHSVGPNALIVSDAVAVHAAQPPDEAAKAAPS